MLFYRIGKPCKRAEIPTADLQLLMELVGNEDARRVVCASLDCPASFVATAVY